MKDFLDAIELILLMVVLFGVVELSGWLARWLGGKFNKDKE